MNLKRKLFFLGLIAANFAFSQNSRNSFFNYSSFGAQYYYGTSIGHTFDRIRDSRPYSGELFYQRQIGVSPFWNHTKRLPQWGLGLSATHAGSQYVGKIVCIYPFVKLPVYTVGPLQGNLRFGFGAAWVEKPYDKVTNPEDLLLSQRISSHANISFQNEVRLSSHHFINVTGMFYHVSNAKTSLPNLGINIPSVSLGYRYAFNGETRKPSFINDSLDKKFFKKIFLTAGVKQMQVPDSSYYLVEVLSGEIGKQLSYSSTVSIGVYITHDESVKTDPLVKHLGAVKNSQVAVYGSYEYNLGRLSIPVQFGVFIYNSNSKLLESVGFRYKISQHWLAELLLKSHLHRADLMHLGVGYKF